MSLGKITFNDYSEFEIYSYSGISEIQSICRAKYAHKKISGAIYPQVKKNIIKADGLYYVDWELYRGDNLIVEDQTFVPCEVIGTVPWLRSENNIPSYLSALSVRYALSHLAYEIYSKVKDENRNFILQNGLICPKCLSSLNLKHEGFKGSYYHCSKGHFIGLSESTLSFYQKELE